MNQTPSPLPVELCVLWGANPEDDTPSSYSFPNMAACLAFVQGIQVAEGSMGAHFVEGAGHYVNKDGEISVRKGGSVSRQDTERFVILGEDPEVGARAARYAFGSAAEAVAFEQGVNEMVGWTAYTWVPSSSHRQINDEDELKDGGITGWLTPSGRARLMDEMAADELAFPILSTPEGDWVNEGWQPQLPPQSASTEAVPGSGKRKSKM